jgi:hypothetical protein
MMRGRIEGTTSSAMTEVDFLYMTDRHIRPYSVSTGVKLYTDKMSLFSCAGYGGIAADSDDGADDDEDDDDDERTR